MSERLAQGSSHVLPGMVLIFEDLKGLVGERRLGRRGHVRLYSEDQPTKHVCQTLVVAVLIEVLLLLHLVLSGVTLW